MTVSSSTSRNSYNGNGTTDTFAYTFRILDEDHIAVYLSGVLQTITTHYTVTGVGNSGGGNIVFVTPPVTGTLNVVFLRNVPITQETDYVENDPFPAAAHEDALDKLTMLLQQTDEMHSRMPSFAITSQTRDITFPEPSADELIGWNAAGDDLENKTVVSLTAIGISDSLQLGGLIIGDAGTEEAGINIGGVTYESTFKVSDINGTNYAQTILHRHSTTLEPLIVGARSNSNTNSHTDLTAGQNAFSIYGTGWAGSNYKIFGSLAIGADSTGTISNTSAPGRWTFAVTPDGSTTPVTALTIKNNKTVALAGPIDTALATVASHATTADIWGAAGNLIDWTGTATTTAFPNAPQAGAERTLVCAGAAVFTAGANMLIDGVTSGNNFTAEAGDKVIVRAVSTTQFRLTPQPYVVVAQATAEAGTDTMPRLWTAERVAQAIAALVPAASGEAIGSQKAWPGIELPDATWDWCDGGTLSRATYATLFGKLMKEATVTMTIASPCVLTWTSNVLRNNHPIKFSTTGALPTGLVAGTTYYLKSKSGDTFQLAATPGGTSINTSGSQSGVHTGICAPHGNGDGSTTFNKPDVRGRGIIGRDDMGGSAASRVTSTGSGINGNVPGASGGAETVSLTSAQNGSHTHTTTCVNVGGSTYGLGPPGKGATSAQSTAVTSGSSGSGTAHLTVGPSIVEDWIIKIS